MLSSWNDARLVLLPKEGKDLRYPAMYRAISILNSVYKILTTTLANRLSSVIGSCVQEDQTGFIMG